MIGRDRGEGGGLGIRGRGVPRQWEGGEVFVVL